MLPLSYVYMLDINSQLDNATMSEVRTFLFVLNYHSQSNNMGLDATKPVFGVSDKVRFKPACSATEIS